MSDDNSKMSRELMESRNRENILRARLERVDNKYGKLKRKYAALRFDHADLETCYANLRDNLRATQLNCEMHTAMGIALKKLEERRTPPQM